MSKKPIVPFVHIIDEADGDVAMCGVPAIALPNGKIVDRAGHDFFFTWAPDNEGLSNCQMCWREWNKRNPAVLNPEEPSNDT